MLNLPTTGMKSKFTLRLLLLIIILFMSFPKIIMGILEMIRQDGLIRCQMSSCAHRPHYRWRPYADLADCSEPDWRHRHHWSSLGWKAPLGHPRGDQTPALPLAPPFFLFLLEMEPRHTWARVSLRWFPHPCLSPLKRTRVTWWTCRWLWLGVGGACL